MSQDTFNKLIPVVQTGAFVWEVWRHIRRIAEELNLANRTDAFVWEVWHHMRRIAEELNLANRIHIKGFVIALNAIDPNTPRWLAWQIIKPWFVESPDDWFGEPSRRLVRRTPRRLIL